MARRKTTPSKTGKIKHISDSVEGPTADIKLLERSGLAAQLDPKVGLLASGANQASPEPLLA